MDIKQNFIDFIHEFEVQLRSWAYFFLPVHALLSIQLLWKLLCNLKDFLNKHTILINLASFH